MTIVLSLIFLPIKIINVHFADIFQNNIRNISVSLRSYFSDNIKSINAYIFSNIKISCVIFFQKNKKYQYVIFFKYQNNIKYYQCNELLGVAGLYPNMQSNSQCSSGKTAERTAHNLLAFIKQNTESKSMLQF